MADEEELIEIGGGENEVKEEESKDEEVTFESLAGDLGWNPNFEGPDKIDAVEYLRNTRPIQDNMKHRLDQLQNTVQRMAVNQEREVVSRTKQIQDDLKARQLEAVSNADTEAYQAATQQLEQATDPRQSAFDAGLEEFKSKNDWYGTDRFMTADADQIGSALLNSEGNFPAMQADEFYAEVLKEVRKRHPEKFANQRRQQSGSVVGDDGPPPNKGNGSWSQAKKDVPGLEAAFKDWVDQGVFKDNKTDREKFAKEVME